ncbi:hypothetical protein E0500_013655 [Streptomyces sp. KM273126]|uniref:hypothetical protein n=1 Tax=Streptomyces sp. KM273126 TaxID=2545247 RepID=UPI0010407727|nr:hypothetical protein [Streptomyces sp. KM273126]MBA2808418.1 hypothetical protein [Streptomyces sp. KM273126]
MRELEAAVDRLNGMTLRSVGRATNMGILEFESQSASQVRLHLQCPFRIVQEGQIILGSSDMAYARGGESVEELDEYGTIFDSRSAAINSILRELNPTIFGARLGEAGAIAASWDPQFRLEVFPACSGNLEMWRMVVPGEDHFGFPESSI